MRELIYLSRGKLRQFAAGRPRHWRSRAQVEGEIKIPGVGGFKVRSADCDAHDSSSTSSRGADLDKVIAALESTDRAARWFTEDVQPGQWVQFEAPMSYTTTSDAVIFLDLNQPTDAYPTGGTIRLMLYGSREHLTASYADTATTHLGPSGWPIRNLLAELDREFKAVGPDRHAHLNLSTRTMNVIDALDVELELMHTAAWIAGYARVTAALSGPSGRRILATPLYVEYISEPS